MIKILALSLLLSAGLERFEFDTGHGAVGGHDWYYFVDIGAQWEAGPVVVYGSVKTDFLPIEDSYMYQPFHNSYLIGARVEFHNLQIGAEHMCGHPQQTFGRTGGPQYDEGYERIYIRGEW